MDNDSNNPAAPARSGQVTGYATVDAALKLADFSATLPNWKKQYQRNDFEEAMHTLAAEVRRLRDESETTGIEYSNLLNLLRHARNGDKDASLTNERMITDAALKCARRAAVKLDAAEATIASLTELLGQRAESHNDEAERRAQQKGNE